MSSTRPHRETLAVAAATAAFQWPFFDRWFSVMDEGHMLVFADLIANGGMLYRDATSYPLPGAFYLLALCFEAFGPSILLSRWLVLLEFSLFTGLLYVLVRRLVPKPYAVASVLVLWLYRAWSFPHWQLYSYSTTALLLLVASLVLLTRFLETERRGTLAFSGLLFGLGVLCKQDYGAAALLAILVVLAVQAASSRDGVRFAHSLGWFLAPAAGVGAATGLHFVLQGQLGFVFQLTVLNHFVGLSTFEYPAYPSLLPLFAQDPQLRDIAGVNQWVPGLIVSAGPDWKTVVVSPLYQSTAFYDTAVKLFVYGPPVFLLAGGVGLWLRRSALGEPERRAPFLGEIALFAFAVSFLALSFLNRPQDYVHLAVLYWPLLCLGVVWTHAALGSRPRVVAVLALAALGPFTFWTGSLLWSLRALHDEPIPGDRAGVYAKTGQAEMLGEIVQYVRERTEPDEPVAAMPYFSIVQFLADRRGPHAASYIVWPFPEYPDRDRRIIDAMEATGTSTVIWNFTQFPVFPPVPGYAPELFAYLVERFEMDRVFADAVLGYSVAGLRRSEEDRLPGRSLVPDVSVGELRVELGDERIDPPSARRSRWVRRALWPFREVLALRPKAGGRTVYAVKTRIPAGSALHTAVGVHPESWFRFPTSAVHFSIVAREGEGPGEVLFERTLDPHVALEDRGWFDVDLPLSRYADRELTLEFATSAAGPTGESLRMGGFGAPRLVSRAVTP